MDGLKRYFIMPFVLVVALASLHTLVGLVVAPSLAWLGAALALWPCLWFFVALAKSPKARTARNLPMQFLGATAGLLLALVAPEAPATAYALFAAVGMFAYVKWYSVLDRSDSKIVVGEPLPAFSLSADDGSPRLSESFQGAPTLFMFVRGNWCPLCMAQVEEVAGIYQYLAEKGTQIVIVAAQEASHTRELAARFDVPFLFCGDPDGTAANVLGIAHAGGTPAGMRGYQADTLLPTVVVTDAEGVVLFADQTDNYRVRPEPEVFLEIIETQVPTPGAA